MRTTRKQVEAAFDRFLAELGGRRATRYDDVGGYRLDYAAEYGGYNVEQVTSKGGAVSLPLGLIRRKANEMFDTLDFARAALRQAKGI